MNTDWAEALYEVVYQHWDYQGISFSIDWQTGYDEADHRWHFEAAPVYQKVLGSAQDGAVIWTPFSFDVMEFCGHSAIEVEAVDLLSAGIAWFQLPRLIVRGKFSGREFTLTLLMEPWPDSKPVEVYDPALGMARLKYRGD